MSDELAPEEDVLYADDAVYEMAVREALKPYVEAARKWWASEHVFKHYGTFAVNAEWAPHMFFERLTKSVLTSPAKGFQAFPLVPPIAIKTDFPMKGGLQAQLGRLLSGDGIEFDDITVYLRAGLRTTFRSTACICFVPTAELKKKTLHQWFRISQEELLELSCGVVTKSLKSRLARHVLKPIEGASTHAYLPKNFLINE
jgi:hypothetical protein